MKLVLGDCYKSKVSVENCYNKGHLEVEQISLGGIIGVSNRWNIKSKCLL